MTPETIVAQWIETARQRSGTTIRHIEKETGISRSKLSKFGGAGARLSFSDGERLCLYFNRDIYELLSISSRLRLEANKSAQKIANTGSLNFVQNDLREVLQWFNFSSGKIDPANPVLQGMSLTKRPSPCDFTLEVLFVGDMSLTAAALGTTNPAVARDFVANLKEHDRVELMRSYHVTADRDDISIFTRKSMPAQKDLSFQYSTVLMPCELPQGEKVIAAHSTLLAQSPTEDAA